MWANPGQLPFTGNLPLDTDGLLALLEGQPKEWSGAPPDTSFSHIHLHVGDLTAAERFYVGVLGFEQTDVEALGQAIFVSAGGYHHHVAFNVWKGRNIPPQPEGVAGLRYYVIRLPDHAEHDRVLARVRSTGLSVQDAPESGNGGTQAGVLVYDPAGLGVVLATDAASLSGTPSP